MDTRIDLHEATDFIEGAGAAKARAFLSRADVEARIKAAIAAAFDRKLLVIAAADLPDSAKERQADKAEEALLQRMRRLMSQTARIHLDLGEQAAEGFLSSVLPLITGTGE